VSRTLFLTFFTALVVHYGSKIEFLSHFCVLSGGNCSCDECDKSLYLRVMSIKSRLLSFFVERGTEGATGKEAIEALGLKRVTEATRRHQLVVAGLLGITGRVRDGLPVYALWEQMTQREKNYALRERGKHCQKKKHHKRLTSEYVRNFVELAGCVLHEDYVNARTPLKYVCEKGHECESLWNNFKRYPGSCGICRPTKQPRYIPDREYAGWRRSISRRLRSAFKNHLNRIGKKKDGHTYDQLGYTPSQLIDHIMSHPNWPLVKDGEWEIDHIFPIKAFIDFGVTDARVVHALDNLRPLSQHDNISKNDKYDREAFISWLATKGVVIPSAA
jgi:hypothetical protein